MIYMIHPKIQPNLNQRSQTYRRNVHTGSPPDNIPNECLPAWTHPVSRTYLQARNVSQDESIIYDLQYCDGGRWKKRIIIPMYDDEGQLRAFQGRSVDGHPEREDKYLTEGPRPIYRPWNFGDVSLERLCVVEGPFDLFSVNRVMPTVAVLGIYPSEAQIIELQNLVQRFDQTTIWFDRGALAQAMTLQLALAPYKLVSVIVWDDSHDPGDCSVETVQEILQDNKGG